ncbi:pyocin knob domain-containing protein [Bacteroides stercoris]|uniref:pyocin knob domain-containing protein n=2 Tax=Bacteroides stercoris TaxID=46506 RepID=UPI00189FEEA5|nr:pyocin knob domain-containing protein [Bacteroides stercoris]
MGAIKTMKEVESALPQKKEINYVRALDKNGNPILINKEDLAQVVGELIDGGAIKQKRSDLKDADQYTTPGTYFVNLWGGVWQNMPTNDCFGLFEVRSYDGYITQRLSAGNGKVFVRIKESEKPFKPWPTAAQ